MNDSTNHIKNTKDQISGEVKEKAAGKINNIVDDKKSENYVALEPATIIAAVVAGVIGLVSLKMFSKRSGSKHKHAA